MRGPGVWTWIDDSGLHGLCRALGLGDGHVALALILGLKLGAGRALLEWQVTALVDLDRSRVGPARRTRLIHERLGCSRRAKGPQQ